MTLIQVLETILFPVAVCMFPGIAWLNARRHSSALEKAVWIVLVSMCTAVWATLAATMLHLPLMFAGLVVVAVSALGVMRPGYVQYLRQNWGLGALAIVASVLYVLASLPFIYIHAGLPTGDSQKAMYFGQQIISTRSLPDYAASIASLNRDPVDFYTPGLHTVIAFIMDASPYPYLSVGFVSIAVSIAVVIVGAAIASLAYPANPGVAATLAGFLIATNVRFLRYVREPGYHLQNVFGELLLFGLLFCLCRLARKFSWADIVLAAACGLTLLAVHQFSAFIAFFVMLAAASLMIRRYHAYIAARIPRMYLWGTALLVGFAVAAAVSFLGLAHKLGDIFTIKPHLTSFLPSISDYPGLMGAAWMAAGLVGAVYASIQAIKRRDTLLGIVAAAGIVVLALSQGPRLFIDIPAVRALFYAVVPLSVAAAVLVSDLWHSVAGKKLLLGILIAACVVPAWTGVATAFHLSHTVRTNSTLTDGIQLLLEDVETTPRLQPADAVVIDGYNRQSLTWMLMSGQPTFTRLASDIERTTAESIQSPLRRSIYVNQLDFEKMYDLGSLPVINRLFDAHNVRFIAGVEGSSNSAFAHNPALKKVGAGDDVTLYERAAADTSAYSDRLSTWLLSASTLANDIGDDEDTFLHLPASLQATRLSAPLAQGTDTYRTTSAPLIPLVFDVADYAAALWNVDAAGHPASDVELLVETTTNPAHVSIVTASGARYSLPPAGQTVRVKAQGIAVDSRGFVTLTLDNPNEEDIGLNVIALGLSHD
jgi:hypothetical protein